MTTLRTVFNLNVIADHKVLRDWCKFVLVEVVEQIKLLYTCFTCHFDRLFCNR